MRGYDFLDKMKLPDTAFVTEANTSPKKQSNKLWIKWVSAAACLCLIFGIGTKLAFTLLSSKPNFLPYPTSTSVPISAPAKLSMITIPQNTMDDMEFEGYLAHDISELVNENPWNESMELSFTHGSSSYEDMKAVSTYLQKEYSDLLGMKNPTANIFGGEYTISGQQHYSIAFFDNTGTDTEKLINYNLNRVHFSCNDDGKLSLIRVYRPDLGNALGNYPIITAKEAKKLLLQGNYITSVPYQMPGNKYISKVELIYRNANWDAIYMPYYKFYVELPEEQREDLKTYGAYYVPAVKSQYISKMPLWNGALN